MENLKIGDVVRLKSNYDFAGTIKDIKDEYVIITVRNEKKNTIEQHEIHKSALELDSPAIYTIPW